MGRDIRVGCNDLSRHEVQTLELGVTGGDLIACLNPFSSDAAAQNADRGQEMIFY